MNRFLFVTLFLVASHAGADVMHPEDINVVGRIFQGIDGPPGRVCFNNDGFVNNLEDCPAFADPVDEGWVFLDGNSWLGGFASFIGGCDVSSADPVSSANCVVAPGPFRFCTPHEWALVQNTKSNTRWALLADANCLGVSDIVPCRSFHAFSSANGCTPLADPPDVAVDSGYLQIDGTIGVPPAEHCNTDAHLGRMMFDGVDNFLYVCTMSGWVRTATTPVP